MDLRDLQSNVFPGESGGDYDALFEYSNRPDGRFSDVRLTEMTLDDALKFASPSGPYGQWVKSRVGRVATPMGAYQVVGSTLRDAKKGLGLRGDEQMTPELQDRIGLWIYQNQGPEAWEGWSSGGGSDTLAGGQGSDTLEGPLPSEALLEGEPSARQSFFDDLGEAALVMGDVAALTAPPRQDFSSLDMTYNRGREGAGSRALGRMGIASLA